MRGTEGRIRREAKTCYTAESAILAGQKLKKYQEPWLQEAYSGRKESKTWTKVIILATCKGSRVHLDRVGPEDKLKLSPRIRCLLGHFILKPAVPPGQPVTCPRTMCPLSGEMIPHIIYAYAPLALVASLQKVVVECFYYLASDSNHCRSICMQNRAREIFRSA